MKITVAGTGYVGLTTGVCLAEIGHHVTCIDIQEEKISLLQAGLSPIYEPRLKPLLIKNLSSGRLDFTTNPQYAYSDAEIIFIAVGTPENDDGTANLDDVFAVARSIALNIENDVLICTKSTVPVGTNDRIKHLVHCEKPPNVHVEVASNPEFLREGSAIFDFFHGDRIVIGASHPQVAAVLEQIYLPLKIPIIKTDIRSAEMIKYVSNAFLATKISFINEIAFICEQVGANVEEVAYGVGQDKRIGHRFLRAGIGYGGSCFPKDTKALVQLSGNVKHKFELLEAVIKVNNRQQTIAVTKVKGAVGHLRGKKVALMGLSFKPNTDDVREAPSLTIIRELLEEGAVITAYDPVALTNAQLVLGDTIEYTTEIRVALTNAEIAIIATEWDEIVQLPLNTYVEYMKEAVIMDGRNCYPLEEVQKYPITYLSIGRPMITNALMNTKSII
ncbi:UDP-glucose/GDP-mannose dehydrogenase family protein [Bacillus sp. FJAT-49705]|uniref:UDP-glucose 6-dehydrogenase n=1 Tax=Cytobacillus citreus TaxID=2833586 RepID=A0ABS5NSN6_9BACI|nr:UDP-glucose/GDP-mannose dehydrogenase family protein [Cytobacillus citreus]